MKICNICKEKKSRDDFYKMRNKCTECHFSKRRKLENKTKHTYRNHKTKKKKKLTDVINDDSTFLTDI